VTGSGRPANNADVTGSNTANDTSRVAGRDAITVRDEAYNSSIKVNSWTKSGTTFIKGGAIWADDIYVGTVNIKGNAVTIPLFATAPRSATIIAPNQFRRRITSVSGFFPGSVSTVFTVNISAYAPDNDTNVLYEIRDENNDLVKSGISSTKGFGWISQHVFSSQGLMGEGNRTFYLDVGCTQPYNNNSGWSVFDASLLVFGAQR